MLGVFVPYILQTQKMWFLQYYFNDSISEKEDVFTGKHCWHFGAFGDIYIYIFLSSIKLAVHARRSHTICWGLHCAALHECGINNNELMQIVSRNNIEISSLCVEGMVCVCFHVFADAWSCLTFSRIHILQIHLPFIELILSFCFSGF